MKIGVCGIACEKILIDTIKRMVFKGAVLDGMGKVADFI